MLIFEHGSPHPGVISFSVNYQVTSKGPPGVTKTLQTLGKLQGLETALGTWDQIKQILYYTTYIHVTVCIHRSQSTGTSTLHNFCLTKFFSTFATIHAEKEYP